MYTQISAILVFMLLLISSAAAQTASIAREFGEAAAKRGASQSGETVAGSSSVRHSVGEGVDFYSGVGRQSAQTGARRGSSFYSEWSNFNGNSANLDSAAYLQDLSKPIGKRLESVSPQTSARNVKHPVGNSVKAATPNAKSFGASSTYTAVPPKGNQTIRGAKTQSQQVGKPRSSQDLKRPSKPEAKRSDPARIVYSDPAHIGKLPRGEVVRDPFVATKGGRGLAQMSPEEKIYAKGIVRKPGGGRDINTAGDVRFPRQHGWRKHEEVLRNGKGRNLTIHYQYNRITKSVEDIKVKHNSLKKKLVKSTKPEGDSN